MATGDVTVKHLGTFSISGGVGQTLSGSALTNITYSRFLSGSRLELIPLGNGMQICALEVSSA